MKKQTPEKEFQHLLRPTEATIARVKSDVGLAIALAEALSFQIETYRTLLNGPDRAKTNNLKSHLDGMVQMHRAAEKKANPAGYDKYEESFEVSAEMIIDVLQAMRKGDLKIVDCTESKAA